jgi:hypothetical protein
VGVIAASVRFRGLRYNRRGSEHRVGVPGRGSILEENLGNAKWGKIL